MTTTDEKNSFSTIITVVLEFRVSFFSFSRALLCVVCVYNKKERKVEIYDVAAVCFFAFFVWLACLSFDFFIYLAAEKN